MTLQLQLALSPMPKRVHRCGVCGRRLRNGKSIRRGIGSKCQARKFGTITMVCERYVQMQFEM